MSETRPKKARIKKATKRETTKAALRAGNAKARRGNKQSVPQLQRLAVTETTGVPIVAVKTRDPTKYATLVARIEAGEYVSPETIASLMNWNRQREPIIPDVLFNYIIATLRGEIKAPTGRPKGSVSAKRQIRWLEMVRLYKRYFAWLKKRQRTQGLKGWKQIRDAEWWDGSPSDRAARMTSRRFEYTVEWHSVRNIVSRQR